GDAALELDARPARPPAEALGALAALLGPGHNSEPVENAPERRRYPRLLEQDARFLERFLCVGVLAAEDRQLAGRAQRVGAGDDRAALVGELSRSDEHRVGEVIFLAGCVRAGEIDRGPALEVR